MSLTAVQESQNILNQQMMAAGKGSQGDSSKAVSDAKKRFQESIQLSRQLMMTTLTHRNPLSEDNNDSSKMAMMMASVTQAEQSFMATEKMQELIDVNRQSQLLQAGQLSGQNIEINGNHFSIKGKQLGYKIPENVANGLIQILDKDNNVVQQVQCDVTPGFHAVNFDARDLQGRPLAPGEYRYTMYLVDNDGGELNTLPKSFQVDPVKVNLGYEMPEDIDRAQLLIRDQSGHVVATLPADKARGAHQMAFDGVDENQKLLDAGSYRFDVEAFNASGKKVGVPTFVTARVDGVGMDGLTPILKVGEQNVPLDQYRGVANDVMSALR